MFFVISKIFELIFTPVHFTLLLTTLGVALCFTRLQAFGRRVAAVGVTALMLMAFGPIGQFLAAPLEARFPPPPDDMPAPDGIIVLGGSVDESLSATLGRTVILSAAERLTAPIELKRRYPNARLVFTGGSASLRGQRVTEADAVRRFWRDVGLDQGDVLYEERSRNTFENAVFSRDLVQPKPGERWLLVTSATHMPRSVGIYRQANFPVIPYPVAYRTNGRALSWGAPHHAYLEFGLVDVAFHEWVGLVAYWLTGKTSALFPAP